MVRKGRRFRKITCQEWSLDKALEEGGCTKSHRVLRSGLRRFGCENKNRQRITEHRSFKLSGEIFDPFKVFIQVSILRTQTGARACGRDL